MLPHKFEAGTPAIGEAVGMGAAIRYLQAVGLEAIQAWEAQLTRHLFTRLQAIDGVRVLGPTPDQQPERGALATFLVDGVHANDIAALIDASGICIRSGHLLPALAPHVRRDCISAGQPELHQHL